MSPRLKLRAAATPLVIAGALWCGSGTSLSAYGGRPQSPPPCGPDGVCIPRPETFGVYQTRWRRFPGDVVGTTPTPAEKAKTGQEELEEDLRGPQEPDLSKEGQAGPTRPEPKAPAEGAAAPPSEGDEPQPGGEPAPGLESLPGLPSLPGVEPQPGAAPSTLDANPLGSRAPSWLGLPPQSNARLEQLPEIPAPEAAFEPIEPRPAPIVDSPKVDGPNLYGDDAPPALPESLKRLTRGGSQDRPTWMPEALNALPPVQQPTSVRPLDDSRVIQASSVQPMGVRVINADGSATAEAGDSELQQAIYFEASDQAGQ